MPPSLRWALFVVKSIRKTSISVVCVLCVWAWFAGWITPARADVPQDTFFVGVGKADITPEHQVRLQGWGHRREESEQVDFPIYVRALAVRYGKEPAVVIIAADSCIIAESITGAIHERVSRASGLTRDRLVLCSTHCHTTPVLAGAPPTSSTIFGVPVPQEHLTNIDRYTQTFIDRAAEAAIGALQEMKPAKLSWTVGKVSFAINRRVVTDNGQISHAQVLKPDDPAHTRPPSGTGTRPVDHALPVFIARDNEGKVVAILTTYSCHCVTFQHNRVTGDWAGYAAACLEELFPDATALVTIGGGGDQNPAQMILDHNTADLSVADAYGRQIADEVQRLAKLPPVPLHAPLTARMEYIDLSLQPLPSRSEWEERAQANNPFGHHARVQLEKLDRGEELQTSVRYPVQSFTFGRDLAMIFLGGELVVDYSLRLKRELDASRIWVHGYSNDIPGYICSERVLKEGGYEALSAIFFDLPAPYAPGLEKKIIDAVTTQVGRDFQATNVSPAGR